MSRTNKKQIDRENYLKRRIAKKLQAAAQNKNERRKNRNVPRDW